MKSTFSGGNRGSAPYKLIGSVRYQTWKTKCHLKVKNTIFRSVGFFNLWTGLCSLRFSRPRHRLNHLYGPRRFRVSVMQAMVCGN